MKQVVLVAAVAAAIVAGIVWAGPSQMTQATVWVVPWDQQGVIEARAGDVLEVWTRPLALVPENLEASFRAKKEGRGVELVGEALPHKEGTMERLYFFKVFEPGPATLTIELVERDGSVRETFSYRVEAVAPGS